MRAWYVAQYALAPAIVRPIVGPDCAGSGLLTCGILAVDFLIVHARAEREVVRNLGGRERFIKTAQSRGLVLLAKGNR
jgi:hypothetical protein